MKRQLRFVENFVVACVIFACVGDFNGQVRYDVWKYANKRDQTLCFDDKCVRMRPTDGHFVLQHKTYRYHPNVRNIPCFIKLGVHDVREVDAKLKPIKGRIADLKWKPILFYINKEQKNRSICPKLDLQTTDTQLEKMFTDDARLSCNSVTTATMNGYLFSQDGRQMGALNIQVSFFRRSGVAVHGYHNETINVEKGDVRLNFTLHKWDWCKGCRLNQSPPKFLEVSLFVESTEDAEELIHDTAKTGYAKTYTVGSGNVILSGIINQDNSFRKVNTVLHHEDFYKDRNKFKIVFPRFEKFVEYQGIYLHLNDTARCNPREVIIPY